METSLTRDSSIGGSTPRFNTTIPSAVACCELSLGFTRRASINTLRLSTRLISATIINMENTGMGFCRLVLIWTVLEKHKVFVRGYRSDGKKSGQSYLQSTPRYTFSGDHKADPSDNVVHNAAHTSAMTIARMRFGSF